MVLTNIIQYFVYTVTDVTNNLEKFKLQARAVIYSVWSWLFAFEGYSWRKSGIDLYLRLLRKKRQIRLTSRNVGSDLCCNKTARPWRGKGKSPNNLERGTFFVENGAFGSAAGRVAPYYKLLSVCAAFRWQVHYNIQSRTGGSITKTPGNVELFRWGGATKFALRWGTRLQEQLFRKRSPFVRLPWRVDSSLARWSTERHGK